MKLDANDAAGGRSRRIRYAVVGLGHIAQNAILPAFAHARENSELTAILSEDPEKLSVLQKRYGVQRALHYRDYEKLLHSGAIDAVYIALPNNLHTTYAIQAANAGIHVLCEKPLAPTAADCRKITEVCRKRNVKLMAAYRLHFERGNLDAIEIVRSGEIGNPRIFSSVFSQQVRAGNMRVSEHYDNGTLYDVGIYCINAARYIFGLEPTEVSCFLGHGNDPRFKQVEEMASAVMRFPQDRLGVFTASFGAVHEAAYEVVGTEGKIRVSEAYDYSRPLSMEITVDGKTRRKEFAVGDQFAPEIIYFSRCILQDRQPEPSGAEALADIRVIEALYESAKRRAPVRLTRMPKRRRPGLKQSLHRRPVKKPVLVNVEAPTV
jgi:glucose-fructose oxidoreductase